jgi:predicted nucleotidyltransferase
MPDSGPVDERDLNELKERAKELACLYAVEEILGGGDEPLEAIFERVARAIPPALLCPDRCRVRIVHEGRAHRPDDYRETEWTVTAGIAAQGRPLGTLSVSYLDVLPDADEGPFLREEVRLIRTIADRLGQYLQQRGMARLFEDFRRGEEAAAGRDDAAWRGAVDLLRRTDPSLYLRLSRRMLNVLCARGIPEAIEASSRADPRRSGEEPEEGDFCNFPRMRRAADESFFRSDEAFRIAARVFDGEGILARIQRWVFENRARDLVKVLASEHSPLGAVTDALRRYRQVVPADAELARSVVSNITVSLIRRFLTEQLDYVRVAKQHIDIDAFPALLARTVSSADSHGKLGGKSTGLFLASRILHKASAEIGLGDELRTPRSWYVASDGLLDFIEHNDLGEVIEQKYKEIDEIREEYPHVVQLFKGAAFPPETARGLSTALDDLGERPIIVRSSSLLEDRLGTAFSGKYKSLFLANQGDKRRRLDALLDAIAEIYASTFGPDPIEYRRERGLLDFNEEMGILVQEVVGARAGKYLLPAFAGVAFSRNEFRWSPRIRREDGLLRLVPGLGTRAVDRLGDDYPILVALGQPGLRTNATLDERIRYSPRFADVIDLEANAFVTVPLDRLLAEVGADYPAFARIFSVHRDGALHRPSPILTDPAREEMVATFDGLIEDSPFVGRMHAILRKLEEGLGTPVDVEFASDGRDLYLLQCRPQSHAREDYAAPIPKDLPPESVVFTANRHVSNGLVPDVTHIVYVDPQRYSDLEQRNEMLAVGRAVGKLNKLLPKRQFILMGPGRWGSRGDVRLGVPVTYADISNTAVLIEVARRQGNYVPDLSFGTHFFQDLVEGGIRYLPLYPDDAGTAFNERFLRGAPNILRDLCPECAELDKVIRVIDVPGAADGRILRVLMNADLEEAVALLAPPGVRPEAVAETGASPARAGDDHWRWRLQMAERIAAELDGDRFGVVAFFVFGSVKNATAGPGSDIDLLIHFRGTPEQRAALEGWLDGWSLALGEMNRRRCGYPTRHLLDVHLVTDAEIAARSSFAVKIGAVTDAARRLPIREA